ncbi:putative aspartic proteinase-like protein 2 [Cocos nucifera]|uniref:Putative aspartic proteinase-like protein 2 n=1 Tax=Cocos nucifera TaxID=13894 RepID=A0A8K0N124_COCNU|nr:putative aspartic proteinase-like protein 2 [Cocos nucifera]
MVLPLFLSSPNSTRRAAEVGHFRRRQLSAANARMRLHDDLLTNGTRGFNLSCRVHMNAMLIVLAIKKKTLCVYERQYAEMSSSSGVLGEDVISFDKESALKLQHAVFGCENSETGDLFSQHADGIMGLGHGQLSVVDQLVEKGVISDSFSLCYGGMDIGGGAMVLGGISPPPGMVCLHSDPGRSPYYNMELKEIHVAGRRLQLDPSIFDSKHGTVLDGGTTYAYLPEEAFIAFKDAIMSKLHSLKQIGGPDPIYKDICFAGAGSDVSQLSKTLPKVDMVFGNGQKLSLSPENYLFWVILQAIINFTA